MTAIKTYDNLKAQSVQRRVARFHCLFGDFYDMSVVDVINKIQLNTIINIVSIFVNKFTLFIRR